MSRNSLLVTCAALAQVSANAFHVIDFQHSAEPIHYNGTGDAWAQMWFSDAFTEGLSGAQDLPYIVSAFGSAGYVGVQVYNHALDVAIQTQIDPGGGIEYTWAYDYDPSNAENDRWVNISTYTYVTGTGDGYIRWERRVPDRGNVAALGACVLGGVVWMQRRQLR